MLVMKFGGTSVGTGERITNVARIVLAHQDRDPVVVTSAMTKVTDALLSIAASAALGDESACESQLAALITRHNQAATAIDPAADWAELARLIAALRASVSAVLATRDSSAAARDSIASWGERLAVILVGGALTMQGGDVLAWDAPIICTDAHFGEATPRVELTRRSAVNVLEAAEGRIIVAPGFIGRAADGRVTTLGRGGSDYSATLLAVALHADTCWIYTDVDGVYTADPRIVREAQILPIVSYATAGRLSYCGAKVLHQRSVAPAARRDIKLRVCNTFRPEQPGTVIAATSPEIRGRPQAVAGRGKLCAVALTGHGLPEIPNLFGRMCKAVTEAGAEIILAAHPVPGYDPQVIIESVHQAAVIAQLEREFTDECEGGHVSEVTAQPDLALCALVGDDLNNTIITLAQRALATNHISPISQSASRDALSFIIPEAELDSAIRHLHHEVIEPALREAAQHASRPYADGQWAAGGRQQQRRRIISPEH